MIGSLRGMLLDRAGTELVVEVNGIGYRVTVTPDLASTVALGDEVFLWVHHQQREDAQTLYGFVSSDERQVFEVLIGTHGVGPSLALAVLAVHPPLELRRVLATDDVAALCLVPGVGRKTAARLLVELKEKLATGEVDLVAVTAGVGSQNGPSPRSDVREALAELGYGADEVAGVLRVLPEDGDAGELLREALQQLAV